MIEPDYANGCIYLKRGDKIERAFNFKEFVSAKQFEPVQAMRNKLVKASKGLITLTETEADNLDLNFYSIVTQTAFTNALPYDEAINIMTTAEVGELAEETLIFLINWSSIEAVKRYASQIAETKKKEILP